MKIAIINRSDSRGGAAVVSRRLMHALRDAGVDARMLVVEKLTDDDFVVAADADLRLKACFLTERAQIFAHNGFNRADLFKVDTASFGLPLERHPFVKEADVVMLNWINQGMLSLDSIRRIAAEKRVIWTMHDLWNATGICHHPGSCNNFLHNCGDCLFLGKGKRYGDLSRRIWQKKKKLYIGAGIRFVAVSNWLAEKCRQSALLSDESVSVIPNAFHLPNSRVAKKNYDGKYTAVMAAARLDDDIKGFPILISALKLLPDEIASRLRIIFCGDIRNRSLLSEICVEYDWRGSVPTTEMPQIFSKAHLVLSPSLYETLPGTLVEGQAYGALPVAFDRGGQRDIITDANTGVLAQFGTNDMESASNFAKAIADALKMLDTTDYEQLQANLYDNVQRHFAAQAVAARYLELIDSMH